MIHKYINTILYLYIYKKIEKKLGTIYNIILWKIM